MSYLEHRFRIEGFADMRTPIILLHGQNEKRHGQDYCQKREHAEITGDIEDGIEAGHAWARWVDLYLTDDQRRRLRALDL